MKERTNKNVSYVVTNVASTQNYTLMQHSFYLFMSVSNTFATLNQNKD